MAERPFNSWPCKGVLGAIVVSGCIAVVVALVPRPWEGECTAFFVSGRFVVGVAKCFIVPWLLKGVLVPILVTVVVAVCFVVSRPRKSRLGINVVGIAVVAGCSVVLRLRKGGAGTIFAASGVAAVDGFFVATPVPKDIVGLAVAAAVGCAWLFS